ncbi:MAG: thiol-disulfide isomerase [Desulfobacteraceae bacterium]|nr:MAG: thiol-disulfide isomerase [Desulfobacteraceae bacterium]
MKKDEYKSATEAFEKALKNAEKRKYVLRLFVSGMTPGSLKAIQNIREICREHLEGRFELEVIDIYQQPDLGKSEQVIAAPTLVRKLPEPIRKFIGDLSDRDKVLLGLNIYPKEPDSTDTE